MLTGVGFQQGMKPLFLERMRCFARGGKDRPHDRKDVIVPDGKIMLDEEEKVCFFASAH